MNIQTASASLNIQAMQLLNIVNNAASLSQQILNIATEINATDANGIVEIAPRIKSLIASMTVQIQATSSQTILVQQAMDELSKLVS